MACLLVAAVAAAEERDWRKDLTDPVPGKHPALAPVVLEYKLSWNGMLDAGQITFVFGKPDPEHPGEYTARAIGGSRGMARKMFDYSHDFSGRLDPSSLRPVAFTGVETGDGRKTTNRNRYDAEGVENEGIVQDLASGREFKGKTQWRFAPLFDLFSAMLFIRSRPLEDGEKVSLAIYPFRAACLLDATVVSHEVHEGRPAIRLDIRLRRIGEKMELLPYEKLKQASLWLSDDKDRLPVDLRTQVFIGDVRMSLVKSTPLAGRR